MNLRVLHKSVEEKLKFSRHVDISNWWIDESGALILKDENEEDVAAYAHGFWFEAKVEQSSSDVD